VEYLEKKYPEAIRRIYRSFTIYFVEIKKMAKKPFATNLQDPFFVNYQKLVLRVFYHWVDFELEKMNNLTLKHAEQHFLKNIRLGPGNFQRQFLEQQFLESHVLSSDEVLKYKKYLERLQHVFTDSHEPELKTTEQKSTQDPVAEINSQSSFRIRARGELIQLDRMIQKKYEKLLKFGKVLSDDQNMSTEEDIRTYQGKQVNFKYDIRKKCGQVNYNNIIISFVLRYCYIIFLLVKLVSFQHVSDFIPSSGFF